MKKINTIIILAVLLFMVTKLNAQEKMNVNYRNGTTLTVIVSEIDSITFTLSEQEEEGVVINGIRWATRNVDIPGTFTAKPEDAGMFYQWNRKVGWSSTDPIINSNGGTTWDYSTPSGTTWEKTNDPCPAGWRVSKDSEMCSLAEVDGQCTTLNGVSGYLFGSGEQSIFLPSVGRRNPKLDEIDWFGYYWSSSMCESPHAFHLSFCSLDNGSCHVSPHGCYWRNFGMSVRCVAE